MSYFLMHVQRGGPQPRVDIVGHFGIWGLKARDILSGQNGGGLVSLSKGAVGSGCGNSCAVATVEARRVPMHWTPVMDAFPLELDLSKDQFGKK